jgi:hypothetical protein
VVRVELPAVREECVLCGIRWERSMSFGDSRNGRGVNAHIDDSSAKYMGDIDVLLAAYNKLI